MRRGTDKGKGGEEGWSEGREVGTRGERGEGGRERERGERKVGIRGKRGEGRRRKVARQAGKWVAKEEWEKLAWNRGKM